MYEAVDGIRIGKKIKELRTQRGVTSEEFGAAIGTSCSAVNMYECGQRVPRDDIKIKIAEFFGVTVESIFYPAK